ncbi:MAG: hypothetical protein HQ567_04465 [Candidatus Nealsonbacteria bacterium]|nr:hypothetical protein [Candidatus Nealsonbacteria bacterium]
MTRTTPNRFVRLVRLARSRGLGRAVFRVADRVVNANWWRRWWRLGVVEIYHAPLGDLRRSRVPRIFNVRMTTQDDLPALEDYFGDPQRVRDRFRRGDACAVCFCGNRIGAAVWFTVGMNDYHEDWETLRCTVRFPVGVAWTFDGKGTKLGAWGALMARLPEFLERLAVEDVYTVIDYDNIESINCQLSLGYRRIGLLVHLRFLAAVLNFGKLATGRWHRSPGQVGHLLFDRNRPSGRVTVAAARENLDGESIDRPDLDKMPSLEESTQQPDQYSRA